MENENEINIQKFFDENQYRTAIVGSGDEFETNEPKGDKLSSLISLLTNAENKDFKEETLLTLKKEKAGDLLIAAIKSPKGKKHKAVLVAACWESEINYSAHLPFFTQLVMDADYLVSLEATTVIETMEGPFIENDLKESIKTLKEYKKNISTEQVVLINDLVDILQERNTAV